MAADGYIGHYVKRSVNADQLYQTVTVELDTCEACEATVCLT